MYPETTEVLRIGCLTELIWIPRFRSGALTPNIDSQTFWPMVISHVTNGTIFLISPTAAISAPLAALSIQLDKLHQKDREEGAGTEGRRKSCGKIKNYSYEFVFNCSGKFLIREKSDYFLRSWETHSCGETGKQDEKKFETWRSAEFLSETEDVYLGGLLDDSAGKLVATEENQVVWEFSESECSRGWKDR